MLFYTEEGRTVKKGEKEGQKGEGDFRCIPLTNREGCAILVDVFGEVGYELTAYCKSTGKRLAIDCVFFV